MLFMLKIHLEKKIKVSSYDCFFFFFLYHTTFIFNVSFYIRYDIFWNRSVIHSVYSIRPIFYDFRDIFSTKRIIVKIYIFLWGMYTNSLDVHCESRQTRFIYRLFGTARGTISQQWRSISWRTNGYRHRMKICEFSCRLYRAWKCFFFFFF